MKKSQYALGFLAAIILLGFFFWLFHPPRTVVRHISIAIATNTAAPGTINFRLENDELTAIFVSDLFVEVKSAGGWRICQQLVPADSRIVSPGSTKDLPVPIPDTVGIWRLRATYGDEMHEPSLFLLKVTFAIERHRIPGSGFGGFSGKNSVIGPELNN